MPAESAPSSTLDIISRQVSLSDLQDFRIAEELGKPLGLDDISALEQVKMKKLLEVLQRIKDSNNPIQLPLTKQQWESFGYNAKRSFDDGELNILNKVLATYIQKGKQSLNSVAQVLSNKDKQGLIRESSVFTGQVVATGESIWDAYRRIKESGSRNTESELRNILDGTRLEKLQERRAEIKKQLTEGVEGLKKKKEKGERVTDKDKEPVRKLALDLKRIAGEILVSQEAQREALKSQKESSQKLEKLNLEIQYTQEVQKLTADTLAALELIRSGNIETYQDLQLMQARNLFGIKDMAVYLGVSEKSLDSINLISAIDTVDKLTAQRYVFNFPLSYDVWKKVGYVSNGSFGPTELRQLNAFAQKYRDKKMTVDPTAPAFVVESLGNIETTKCSHVSFLGLAIDIIKKHPNIGTRQEDWEKKGYKPSWYQKFSREELSELNVLADTINARNITQNTVFDYLSLRRETSGAGTVDSVALKAVLGRAYELQPTKTLEAIAQCMGGKKFETMDALIAALKQDPVLQKKFITGVDDLARSSARNEDLFHFFTGNRVAYRESTKTALERQLGITDAEAKKELGKQFDLQLAEMEGSKDLKIRELAAQIRAQRQSTIDQSWIVAKGVLVSNIQNNRGAALGGSVSLENVSQALQGVQFNFGAGFFEKGTAGHFGVVPVVSLTWSRAYDFGNGWTFSHTAGIAPHAVFYTPGISKVVNWQDLQSGNLAGVSKEAQGAWITGATAIIATGMIGGTLDLGKDYTEAIRIREASVYKELTKVLEKISKLEEIDSLQIPGVSADVTTIRAKIKQSFILHGFADSLLPEQKTSITRDVIESLTDNIVKQAALDVKDKKSWNLSVGAMFGIIPFMPLVSFSRHRTELRYARDAKSGAMATTRLEQGVTAPVKTVSFDANGKDKVGALVALRGQATEMAKTLGKDFGIVVTEEGLLALTLPKGFPQDAVYVSQNVKTEVKCNADGTLTLGQVGSLRTFTTFERGYAETYLLIGQMDGIKSGIPLSNIDTSSHKPKSLLQESIVVPTAPVTLGRIEFKIDGIDVGSLDNLVYDKAHRENYKQIVHCRTYNTPARPVFQDWQKARDAKTPDYTKEAEVALSFFTKVFGKDHEMVRMITGQLAILKARTPSTDLAQYLTHIYKFTMGGERLLDVRYATEGDVAAARARYQKVKKGEKGYDQAQWSLENLNKTVATRSQEMMPKFYKFLNRDGGFGGKSSHIRTAFEALFTKMKDKKDVTWQKESRGNIIGLTFNSPLFIDGDTKTSKPRWETIASGDATAVSTAGFMDIDFGSDTEGKKCAIEIIKKLRPSFMENVRRSIETLLRGGLVLAQDKSLTDEQFTELLTKGELTIEGKRIELTSKMVAFFESECCNPTIGLELGGQIQINNGGKIQTIALQVGADGNFVTNTQHVVSVDQKGATLISGTPEVREGQQGINTTPGEEQQTNNPDSGVSTQEPKGPPPSGVQGRSVTPSASVDMTRTASTVMPKGAQKKKRKQ